MVQVQNKINYGVAYVSQEQADRLGADWQEGSSLTPPPFVPPWGSGGSEGGSGGSEPPTAWPTPMPTVDPNVLTGVEVNYLPGGVVEFTAVKGEINDPNNEESFTFVCTQDSSLNGSVRRTFTKTFTSEGTFDCELEDLYGDGSGSTVSRKKVRFQVTPTLAAAEVVVAKKATTSKRAPAKKG